MGIDERKAVMRTDDYKKSIMYGAQLACLSIIREEGLITDDEEYFYLQQKIKDKYSVRPTG